MLAGIFSVIAAVLVYVNVYGCVVVAVAAGWAVRCKSFLTRLLRIKDTHRLSRDNQRDREQQTLVKSIKKQS